MRLDESVGENSEYYSDDEELGKMENDLRDSYKSLNPQSNTSDDPNVNVIGSSDYTDLLSQI